MDTAMVLDALPFAVVFIGLVAGFVGLLVWWDDRQERRDFTNRAE